MCQNVGGRGGSVSPHHQLAADERLSEPGRDYGHEIKNARSPGSYQLIHAVGSPQSVSISPNDAIWSGVRILVFVILRQSKMSTTHVSSSERGTRQQSFVPHRFQRTLLFHSRYASSRCS